MRQSPRLVSSRFSGSDLLYAGDGRPDRRHAPRQPAYPAGGCAYLERHSGGSPDRPPVEPLYGEDDVRGVIKLLDPLEGADWHELSPALRLCFTNAGHILGSAVVQLDIEDDGEMRRVVFTGDLGRRGMPLLCDPQLVEGCDVLITESTYADAIHPPPEDLKARLLKIIERADAEGGKVVIPAFSLGRTQQALYFLRELTQAGKLPKLPIFVDSPLANRVTDVFRQHAELFDAAAARNLAGRTATCSIFPC